jgi:curved DNA-binding protein CbpA
MTLGSPDPYAVLGVPRDASEDQIAQARRRLSREYHPDVNPAAGAAARFDQVQQAFRLLSDPATRSRYDRARDERGGARVTRDPGGGYGFATEASPEVFIQPTSVDFGLLTPRRPYADAKVTVAWTGAWPGRLESTPGGKWWASLGSERPATGCIVFYLRAHAHAGTPNGRQHAEFTVIFDDTALTVQLAGEIQGEFAPGSRPDFTPLPRADLRLRPAWPGRVQPWVVLVVALAFVLIMIAVTR